MDTSGALGEMMTVPLSDTTADGGSPVVDPVVLDQSPNILEMANVDEMQLWSWEVALTQKNVGVMVLRVHIRRVAKPDLQGESV